ncbi:zinc finger HIT domain-containing protein 3 [Tribolium castaneum]|uniref:Zinc finger HIT domain-containing protein 3-like Protein n=1 Tax=Tribolium castaneum TaxID=7070 RepID=D6WYY5_TRICA|nr:PREDICTED: zinc finger HIT domain-containing protein 3 [Tribolium castaneum]EFA09025.1 Zinc finger HIT domain-containing protein 3-like Protein [Tribolium castaneum]|eukprot:XP_969208.1 PREDICTED: zinc finger HIT domain-containing protein 3 [Tribolium castaneum]
MDKTCVICKEEGKYKCPTCFVYYCSVQCCRKHRENKCDVWVKNGGEALPQAEISQTKARYTSADTVPFEKLQLLNGDENLKNLLCNPHLRDLLVTINNSKEPEKIMQMAMQEPLFLEFADACLKVVEPPRDD